MGDADLFAKLNRILETHNLSSDGNDESDDFLERFTYDLGAGNDLANKGAPEVTLNPAGQRPTPFEVWKSKQSHDGHEKKSAKLSSEQWDGLVNHLHKTNKLKESAVMKEQNQGLAAEFSGHQFKPQMNKRSQELMANKRDALHTRVENMKKEREAVLERKRTERANRELDECSFKPERSGGKTSDKILKKLGRQNNSKGTLDPEYFFKYHEEKLRRNAVRQQIVSEMTERELTFKPSQNANSVAVQEKLAKARAMAEGALSANASLNNSPDKGALNSSRRGYGSASPSVSGRLNSSSLSTPRTPRARSSQAPFSSLTKQSAQKIKQLPNKLLSEAGLGDPTAGDYMGNPIVVESAHPYKNNTVEYTTINIQGAISYTIEFDENTRTESIHDYVKFFVDDSHIEHYGSGKYSGGMRVNSNSGTDTGGKVTPCNWPGVGGRPALVIPASRFVVCFRTNGSVTDWGFKLHAVPLMSGNTGQSSSALNTSRSENQPVISNRGKMYGRSSNNSDVSHSSVYDRLHDQAMVKSVDQHNKNAELMQKKLNISLKPWEITRKQAVGGNSWTQSKTYAAKKGVHVDYTGLLIKKPVPHLSKEHDENASVNTAATGDMKSVPYTTIDFDDNVESLWKSLRLAETSATYAIDMEPQGGFVTDDEEGNAALNNMPEL